MADTPGTRFDRLVDIMRRLRAPDGCPWDREQTHHSLRRYVLEETYEVLDAIESGTPDDLCEELGDFLFEAVFLARLSEEAGDFSIGDAIDAACDKLVRRHPHVFARPDGAAVLTSSQVVENWEVLKAREREAAGRAPKAEQGTLAGVPASLPALLRAYRVSGRAAAVGFDWARASDVFDKIQEELAETRRAVDAGDAAGVVEEIGDLLFAVANLSRKLGVEPEAALRQATGKFARRFAEVEVALSDRGRPLGSATLDEMETEWQRVKATSRASRDRR